MSYSSIPASPRRRGTIPTPASPSGSNPRRRRNGNTPRPRQNTTTTKTTIISEGDDDDEDAWASDLEGKSNPRRSQNTSSGSSTPLKVKPKSKPSSSSSSSSSIKGNPKQPPSILSTLSLLILSPLRTLLLILSPFVSPLIAHLINIIILTIIAILTWRFILPRLLKYLGWTLWQPIKIAFKLITGGGGSLSSLLSIPRIRILGYEGGKINLPGMEGLPGVGELVKGVCEVAPLLCSGFGVFGALSGGGRGGMGLDNQVDVAQVARALHKEATDAKDIFDSVSNLGIGGMEAGLHYTRIWELATAISVSSHLPDKQQLGADLMELGGLSRDLSDEMSRLTAQSNSAFAWIVTDFERLLYALSDPSTSSHALANIDSLVHSLMLRISETLDDLLLATERAIPKADQASSLGTSLMKEMRKETDRLEMNIRKEPPWKRWAEKGKEFALGQQEPTKMEMLSKDLELSVVTIQNVRNTRDGLESARQKLRLHAEHVGLFRAGLVGSHLGRAGMDPVEKAVYGADIELRFLKGVVEDMKGAVQESKRGRGGGRGGHMRETID